MALLLVAALSLNALVLSPPATSTTVSRTAVPHMNEARAKAAWLAKVDQTWNPKGSKGRRGPARPAAQKRGPRLAMPNLTNVRPARRGNAANIPTRDNPAFKKVYEQQEKAKKQYIGPPVELCTSRKAKGWTTN